MLLDFSISVIVGGSFTEVDPGEIELVFHGLFVDSEIYSGKLFEYNPVCCKRFDYFEIHNSFISQ